MPATKRQTAAERRQAVLDAADEEFALKGFEGASTDVIARRAGISQPYLFRLFGTKKALFIESCVRCNGGTLALFQEAAAGLSGQEALEAMGTAYLSMITVEPNRLRGQLQAYAACGDPEVSVAVQEGFGRLVDYVQRVSGVDAATLANFFATGMLANVMVAMGAREDSAGWARTLSEGFRHKIF